MTPEQIAKIMALVDEFATTTAVVAVGRDRALNTQSQTEDAIEARNAVEAELRAPQQAEEILQSLGWTCIGGVWTEDRAATATLASQQAEPMAGVEVFRLDANINGVDHQLVEFVRYEDHARVVHDLETICDPAGLARENAQLWDTNEGLQRMYRSLADTSRAPTAEQHYEEQPDGTMLPDGPEPDERAEFEIELRKQCFQKPTPEAYDLAWCMWQARASKAKP